MKYLGLLFLVAFNTGLCNGNSNDTTYGFIRVILINEQPVNFQPTGEIMLKTNDRLTILLDSRPEIQKFTFQLSGYETAPNEVAYPLKTYGNLPKGKYILKISAFNTEGAIENEAIQVEVRGAFLQSWFWLGLISLYLVLILVAALAMIKMSASRSLQKLSDLRNDWTNKLHNDIGGDLSSVALRLNTLKRILDSIDPAIQESIAKTYNVLNSIQKKLRFVFDLVDPKKNTFEILMADLEAYAQENCALKGMEFEYVNALKSNQDIKIDIGRANKVYLCLKEVINNSIKYSKATHISILLKSTKNGVMIVCKDNGIGFDVTQKFSGNGLENLKQYKTEGFIDINIESDAGKGTAVELFVPNL